MRPSLLLLVLAGCATTSTSGEVRAVERTLSERLSLELTLPPPGDPDVVDAEVATLLETPLDPARAARLALLSNRTARVHLAELGMARGELVQAGLLPNPHAEVDVRKHDADQPLQVDLGLDLDLTALVLTPLKKGVAESKLEAAKQHAAGALLELATQAKLGCLELQASERRLELRTKALEALQASWVAAKTLHKAGNLNALDLASETSSVELARLQVAEAEAAMLDARERLVQVLGLSGAQAAVRVAGFPSAAPAVVSSAEAEGLAIRQSLELGGARERQEAAARQVGLEQVRGWLPQITAGFHGERDDVHWELGAHVEVSLPTFDRRQGATLVAQSEYDAARARAEVDAVRIRSTVRQLRNRLESSAARAKHVQERLLPARAQVLKETLAQYNAMTRSVFDVLQAHRMYTETGLLAVDALAEAWRAHTALELVLAGWSQGANAGPLGVSVSVERSSAAGH